MTSKGKRTLREKTDLVVSSVFGIGYFPFAPATAATFIVSVCFYVFLKEPHILEVGICLLLFVVAVKSSGGAERILGHDAREIVIDEVCGVLVTLLFLERRRAGVVIAAFFIFRFFDIVKPWPVRRSQNLPGGLGIVMDDVLAGVYSNLLLRILLAARAI